MSGAMNAGMLKLRSVLRSPSARNALPVGAAVLLLLIAMPAVAQGPAQSAADQQLDQLLARLGLVDLQILHLERTLGRASGNGEAANDGLAQRLADLYAARLMDQSGDQPAYEETLGRIEALVRRHPQANTTALQVMLLQADYNRAESLIGTWTADPDHESARSDARAILARIAPLLDQYQQDLAEQLDKLVERMDLLEEGDDEATMLERETRRLQNVAARATYFAAWANYYLPVVLGATDAASYERARLIFRKLLGIGDQPLEEIDAEWLGLESIWRSRALVGLGLCEAACGRFDECDRCFELLDSSSVPVEVKEQAPYWYTRALVQGGQLSKAARYASQRIERLRPPATQGLVSFCVLLVRTGYGPPADQRSEQHRELGRLGLNGLARLQQTSAIRSLVERYDVPREGAAEFVLLWASGQKQFGEAERTKSDEDYRSSAATLEQALKSPEADSLAPQAAEARYTLGWCYYRLSEFQIAAREFEKAITPLKAAGNPLAVEAAWMAFTAYRRLAVEQPRYVSAASDVLRRLQRDFPDHPYAQRADYEAARLLADRSPEEMIRSLEAIPRSDPNYESARYDLTQAWFRKWSAAKSSAVRQQAADELNKVALSFLAINPQDAGRKVKCCLLMAHVALSGDPSDRDGAEQALRRAQPWVDDLPAGSATVAEYHYRQLQLATAQGDQDARRQHAEWLATHAAGSPYELAALTVVASTLDRQAREAAGQGRPAPVDQAREAFDRLSRKLGSSPEAIASSKNAQVAASRLAHYAAQAGDFREAAELLDRLLTAYPKDRGYLRRSGMADFQAGNFDRSLKRWRTLLAGLPKDADSWFEAKYYQIKCLQQTSPQQAQKVLRQFQLLHPQLGPPAWRDQFQQLNQ